MAKNRLAKLALKDTSYEPIADLFKGQTCVRLLEGSDRGGEGFGRIRQGE